MADPHRNLVLWPWYEFIDINFAVSIRAWKGRRGGVDWAATPGVVGRYSEIERGDPGRVGCSCGARGSDIEFYRFGKSAVMVR